jgi:phenylpropionate dioxygenase-like ring-hydroxylating dioxygenase large terminal subunit
VVRHRDERVVDVNWKTLVDNVIECYHCATVHPELSANFDTSAAATVVEEFACGSAILVPPRADLSADEAFRRQHHMYFMPPTAYYSCKGALWALMVVVDPITEHRSRLLSVFLAPESLPQGDLDAIIKSAELVNEQDVAASTSAQAGYDLAPGFDAYQLPHSEQSLRRFARLVLESVS